MAHNVIEYKTLVSSFMDKKVSKSLNDLDIDYFSKFPPEKILDLFEVILFNHDLDGLKAFTEMGILDLLDLGYYNPLFLAINNDFDEGVKYLCKYKELLDGKNKNGETILNLAIKKDKREMVEALINGGADPLIKNSKNESALSLCMNEEEKSYLELLKEKNPSINETILKEQQNSKQKDLEKTIASVFAINNADFSKYTSVIDDIFDEEIGIAPKEEVENKEKKFLNDLNAHFIEEKKKEQTEKANIDPLKGVDVNSTNKSGQTIFMLAAERGQYQLLKEIEKKGPKANITDRHGRNVLHYAVLSGNEKVIETIKKWNMDRDGKDSKDLTPLLYAIKKGFPQIVKALLKIGCDPKKGSKGSCPLIFAAQMGDLKICKLILEYGGDINTRDSKNRSAADVAFENGHSAASIFLKKYKAKLI